MMTERDTFHCTVVTPERSVLDCAARFVAFPAHDGEVGVLTRRAPMVCKLGVGVLRVETAQDKHLLLIDGGFAQAVGDRLTILTNSARRARELDVASARQSLVEARAMKITDDVSAAARSRAMRHAQLQIKLAHAK